MPKLTSPFRIVSIILLFLIGINAVIAGVLFIMDPSGSKMGMSVDYLSPSPFQSYLIPGIVLLVFNGLLGIVSGVMSIRRVKNYSNLILLQGVILIGWILIQILMVRDINLLHVIMFLFGLILIFCSLFLKRNTKHMKTILSAVFLIFSTSLNGQSSLTTKDILSKELLYHFEGGYIRMVISSDTTLYWKNDSRGTEAHERSKTTHLDDSTIMTAWYESDKTFVTLFSDFKKLRVSGMVSYPDGRFYPINGTIEVKL